MPHHGRDESAPMTSVWTPRRPIWGARRGLGRLVALLLVVLASSTGLLGGIGCAGPGAARAADHDATVLTTALPGAVIAGHCVIEAARPDQAARHPSVPEALTAAPLVVLAAPLLPSASLLAGVVPPSRAVPPAQHPPNLLGA